MAVVRRFGDVGEVDAYLSTVMGKDNFCNVGDLMIGVQSNNLFSALSSTIITVGITY